MAILARWSSIVFLLAASAAADTPAQLANLAGRYLDTRSASAEFQLREYSSAHGKEAAGSLGYFVLGYGQWMEKHYPQAAGYLRLARASHSPLSDYADYYLASALQNGGDHAAAIPVLTDFEARHPGSPLISRGRFALATSYVSNGAGAKALAILKAHFGSFPHPAADLLQARALEASGDNAAAMAAYSEIYYRYPASAEAEEAGARKADFPKPSVDLLRARADSLMSAKHYTDAPAAYRTLAAAAKGVDREHAQVALAAILCKTNHHPQARQALAALDPETPEASAERLYWLAETDRRLKREQDLRDDVAELGKEHGASPWLEEALYAVATFELVKNGIEKAAPYYDELSKRFPNGKYAAQSHWKVAWARYRAGDYDSAGYLMNEQVKTYPGSVLTPAALYWSGRIAEPSSATASQNFFRRAVEMFPNNYYGLVSLQRLTAPVTKAGIAYTAPPVPPNAVAHKTQFETMRALGMIDFANAELRQMIQNSPQPLQPYWWMELAIVEKEAGRIFVSIDSVRRAIPQYTQLDWNTVPRAVWDLLYPLPWWQDVREAAAHEGLDPYLVAGLIRQESLFNPRVISPAKAYGLMQILPSTGRQLARKLGVSGYSTNSLFVPRINIRMGVHYLRQLIDDAGGHVEDALTAYNAGESRLEKWHRSSYKDSNEFIESIPFTETREYVQIVLRNAALYRKLYPPPDQAGARQGTNDR